MTREQVEKGIKRMEDFYKEIDHPVEMVFGDGIYKEAMIRTMMEFDSLESFDHDTRRWFIEDEDEFQKAREQTLKEIETLHIYLSKFNRHYEELEKEESNETYREDC